MKKEMPCKPRCSSMIAAALISVATMSMAQNTSGSPGALAAQGHSVATVTPVYGQLVMFTYPVGFKPAYAKDAGTQYTQEFVLDGETVEKWSQMVTLTGSKGLAANQEVTPQRLLQHIAVGFQRSCPSSFAAQAVGPLKISGHDAFAALVGCGTVSTGEPRSEVAILLAVKGTADYYTIQWAERGQQSLQPPRIDPEKWLGRLKQLYPIKLCSRIPNEPAPYLSCINQPDARGAGEVQR
jgi:hypothetical protein